MKDLYKEKKKSLAARLAKYSAATAAVVAVGANAEAQISYSGVQDSLITDFGILNPMDLDGDGITDFNFGLAGTSTVFNTYFYSNSAFVQNPASNSWVGSRSVYHLESHDLIGESTVWANFNNSYNNLGFNHKNFLGKGKKFMGVRFDISGNTHYGWVRLDITNDADTLKIVDWAYNTKAGAAIFTGQVASPSVILSTDITYHLGSEFNIMLTFSESVDMVEESEITVTNGVVKTGSLATADKIIYTATIIPNGNDDVTVFVDDMIAVDDLGNPNAESNRLMIQYAEASSNYVISLEKTGLYPNPSNGLVHITTLQSNSTIIELSIIDQAGRLVYTHAVNNSEVDLDVSFLEKGVYFVKIKTDNSESIENLLIE